FPVPIDCGLHRTCYTLSAHFFSTANTIIHACPALSEGAPSFDTLWLKGRMFIGFYSALHVFRPRQSHGQSGTKTLGAWLKSGPKTNYFRVHKLAPEFLSPPSCGNLNTDGSG